MNPEPQGRKTEDPDLGEPHRIGGSPIFIRQWENTDQMNARLRDLVLHKADTTPGLKKSNCGGWHSEIDFQLWDDADVRELLNMLHTMLRQVVEATVPAPTDRMFQGWDVESWANVNQVSDSAAMHTHIGGVNLWSAVYYVDTGEEPGAVGSGFTRFVDMSGIPRAIKDGSTARRPSEPVKHWQDRCGVSPVGEEYDLQVEPAPGKMLMFPSTLPHYVTPYLSASKRITIAFNLRHPAFIVADPENPYARRRVMWRNHRAAMLTMYKGKRVVKENLARVVPVERWPRKVRRTLLGGS